ncbi:MAG: NUDIX hydrolase [Chitinophagales bacterium]
MDKLPKYPGKWKAKSSKTIYDNPWIHLEEYQVVDPSGNDTIYSVLDLKSIAVGIIPLDEELNTWIVGQYRFPLNDYFWEIVEGGGDKTVSPVESAKRELLEETGIKAGQWTELLKMVTSNCATSEEAIVFVARDLSFGPAQPDDNEDLKIIKLPFEELYQRAMQGEITDGISLAAIFKLKALIDRGAL